MLFRSDTKGWLSLPSTTAILVILKQSPKVTVANALTLFSDGLITEEERYRKTIQLWTKATDDVTDAMMDNMARGKDGFNPVSYTHLSVLINRIAQSTLIETFLDMRYTM